MFSKSSFYSFLKGILFSTLAILILIFTSMLGYKFAKVYFNNLEQAYFQIVNDAKEHILLFEAELIKGLYENR